MSNETSTALVLQRPAALERRERAPLTFTDDQRHMIRRMFMNGANDEEAGVLMEIAKAKRLNPFLGQIHFVKRNDRERGPVWSCQTSIDGFRSIAEDTGLYDGQDATEFEYEDDKVTIKLARTKVYRKDVSRAFVGEIRFSEYAPRLRDGNLMPMWAQKPHVMAAKCSEAAAFRKAFPLELAQIYTAEEMAQAQDEQERLSSRIAPSEQPARIAVDWPKEIASCEPTRDALDALARRMNEEVPRGSARDALRALLKARYAEVAAAPKKAPACAACGLEGRHVDDCPNRERERVPGEDDE